jgi:hypothetical protein
MVMANARRQLHHALNSDAAIQSVYPGGWLSHEKPTNRIMTKKNDQRPNGLLEVLLFIKESLAAEIALLLASFYHESEGLLSYGGTDTKIRRQKAGSSTNQTVCRAIQTPLETAKDFGLQPGPEALEQLKSTCHCLMNIAFRYILASIPRRQ